MKSPTIALLALLLGCGSGRDGGSRTGQAPGTEPGAGEASGRPAGKHDRDAGPVEPLSEDVEVPPAP